MRRYRWRTRVRTVLPVAVIGLVPKGRKACGAHEWYRHGAEIWHCYHCAVGVAVSPVRPVG